jgi:ABC-type uncharacterized transport system involved in gliding motility auxiliary subunit
MKSGSKFATIVLLVVALVLLNYLAASFPARIDLTEQRIYTLSPGSRSLLRQIEEPVHLDFYFSRSIEGLPIVFKNYATRVEEMLRQYVAAAGGRVTLRVIDPKPDTPQEEAATRAGLSGQPLPNGQTLYFGLVAQQADQEKTLAFFTPQRESFLEYDISQLIYSVQQLERPKLGLITSLPLRGGGGFAMPGMPPPPRGQVVAEEWDRTFEIVDIAPSASELPADLDVLAVVHPQNLGDALVYAIDQFVLSGRPLFLALDPSSRHFRNQGGQAAMFGGPTPNVSSDLPRLLSAWGVNWEAQNVVGDLDLATTVSTQQGPASYPVWLSLREENLGRDFVPTSALRSLLFVEAGSFTIAPRPDREVLRVVESSRRSSSVSGFLLQFGQPAELARQITPSGEPKLLAALLRGTFRTAFPDGPPRPPAADDEDNPTPVPSLDHRTESTRPGTVFLVGDTDWLLDDFSVRRLNFLGLQALEPLNDNLAFGSNLLEFLGGSDDLISIRGKGSSIRPFDVVRRMEVEAQAKYQAQLQTLELRLQDVQNRLSQLLAQQKDNRVLVATPEMQAEIDRFRAEEAAMRAERRAIRAALREDIARLETVLILLNLLAMPGLVTAGGIWFFFHRSQRRRRILPAAAPAKDPATTTTGSAAPAP